MAFLWSVEKLFEFNEKVYMWTFTWKVPHDDDFYGRSWNKFRQALVEVYPLVIGLRVFEMHPGSWRTWGESHGVHVHALFNDRIDIERVQKIADRYGIGRIHVQQCNQDEAMYLAKYLTKKPARPLPKGMRAFGTIGTTRGSKFFTTVREVKIYTQISANVTTWQHRLKIKRMTPDFIHTIYMNTKLHGKVEDWPIGRIKYHGKNAEKIMAPLMLSPAKRKSRELIARKWKTKGEDRAKRTGKNSPAVSSGVGLQKPVEMKEEAVEIGSDYWEKFPGMTDGTRLAYYRRVPVAEK